MTDASLLERIRELRAAVEKVRSILDRPRGDWLAAELLSLWMYDYGDIKKEVASQLRLLSRLASASEFDAFFDTENAEFFECERRLEATLASLGEKYDLDPHLLISRNSIEWERLSTRLCSRTVTDDGDAERVRWSAPDSPNEWAKVFKTSARTFKRWVEAKKVKAHVIDEKNIILDLAYIPKRVEQIEAGD